MTKLYVLILFGFLSHNALSIGASAPSEAAPVTAVSEDFFIALIHDIMNNLQARNKGILPNRPTVELAIQAVLFPLDAYYKLDNLSKNFVLQDIYEILELAY